MVGTAISTHKGRIALDVGKEPMRFSNPLLPYTRSEIALPLIVGEHVLGALDVQSTKEAAFSEQDIETFQGMANQVAIALENARLFLDAQQSLEEIRSTHQQSLMKGWAETARAEGGLEYAIGDGKDETGEKTALDIPLSLREQIIGKISLEGDEEWTPEDRGWIEAVATQAALALENARLLEESQQLALHERVVAEITSKVWSSATLDGILQTAIKELGRTLNASEATIELKEE
jgi:GAF domain-containing protein